MSIIQNSGNNSGGSKAEASDRSRSPQGPDMLNSARLGTRALCLADCGTPAEYFPIAQTQMSPFNGEHGELFGSVIEGEIETQ
jgi:hypothetical protein